jgi:hypothetical protein
MPAGQSKTAPVQQRGDLAEWTPVLPCLIVALDLTAPDYQFLSTDLTRIF